MSAHTSHTPGWRYEVATKTIRAVPSNHWVASMDSFDGAENHEANARLIAAAPVMKDFLLDVPHNDQTATHRMIGHVFGCRGCEARALYKEIEG